MIFITVGTHEQQFNRLLKCIDNMIDKGLIKEEVKCQKGFSDYNPVNYKAEKLISYKEMVDNISKARIVITHGGPSSFISTLSVGKIPIVVPRKKEYKEHVNNHQVNFTRQVEKRMNNIIVAETEEDIINSIVNYDKIIKDINSKQKSNNDLFVKKLKKEIEDIL